MKIAPAPYPHHFAVLDPEGVDTFGIRNLLKEHSGILSSTKRWIFPLDSESIGGLKQALGRAGLNLSYDVSTVKEMGNDLYSGDLEFHLKPYAHQVVGTRWLMANRGAILIDEMGLGKTKQAIDAAVNLGVFRAVVICPASIVDNWESEIRANDPDSLVFTMGGPKKERTANLRAFRSLAATISAWLIVNYEKVRYNKNGQTSPEAAAIMELTKGALLICDEAHRLKNGQAQCSTAVRMMLPDRIWLLTGTPVANRPVDVWHLCRLVRPGLLGWYFSNFDSKHIVRDRFGGVSHYKDMHKIKAGFSSVSMGRKKSEVLDLPDKIFITRVVTLSATEMVSYKQMVKNMVAWMHDGRNSRAVIAKEAVTKFIRLRQLANGFGVNDASDEPTWVDRPSKIADAIEVWEDAGRPRVLIWCIFRQLIRKVVAAFGLEGARVLQIHGDVPPSERQSKVDEWSTTDGCVMVAQIDTAGVGLNLQAGSFQIFLDPANTPMQRLQAVDRQHRIGQTEPVTVIDIVAKGTVDVMINRRLAMKIAEGELITEGSFRQALLEDFAAEHGIDLEAVRV